MHRGASDATLRQYSRGAGELIDELGADAVAFVVTFLKGLVRLMGAPVLMPLATLYRTGTTLRKKAYLWRP